MIGDCQEAASEAEKSHFSMTDPTVAALLRKCTVKAATVGHPILARLAAAEAIVGRLPKTADGVPATPDMTLFCPNGHQIEPNLYYFDCSAACESGDCVQLEDFGYESPTGYTIAECYSTRAALAADAARKDGVK
jgi:hypothetical protein